MFVYIFFLIVFEVDQFSVSVDGYASKTFVKNYKSGRRLKYFDLKEETGIPSDYRTVSEEKITYTESIAETSIKFRGIRSPFKVGKIYGPLNKTSKTSTTTTTTTKKEPKAASSSTTTITTIITTTTATATTTSTSTSTSTSPSTIITTLWPEVKTVVPYEKVKSEPDLQGEIELKSHGQNRENTENGDESGESENLGPKCDGTKGIGDLLEMNYGDYGNKQRVTYFSIFLFLCALYFLL